MRPIVIASLLAAALLLPASAAAADPLPVIDVAPQGAIGDEDVPAQIRMPGFDGAAAIEVRGQWSSRLPKKSYTFELQDAEGDNVDAPLLGMPEDDDWVLYAAYNDRTLMRNVLAYETARRVGGYAARTRYVELRLNGDYEGVYVLMEKPKLQKNRVQGSDDAFLLELTSGYQARRKGGPSFRTPITRRPVLWEDPERDDLERRQARAITRQVAAAERALYRGRPGAWKRHLHARSAVNYLLVNELFKNQDGMHTSAFMTGEPGGKLRLGPVWDMDMSMGVGRFVPMREPSGWMLANRPWAEPLYENRAFARMVQRRWRALKADGLRQWLLGRIGAHRGALVDAAAADSARWPEGGARPAGTHDEHVAQLESWIGSRVAWMDRNVRRLGR